MYSFIPFQNFTGVINTDFFTMINIPSVHSDDNYNYDFSDCDINWFYNQVYLPNLDTIINQDNTPITGGSIYTNQYYPNLEISFDIDSDCILFFCISGGISSSYIPDIYFDDVLVYSGLTVYQGGFERYDGGIIPLLIDSLTTVRLKWNDYSAIHLLGLFKKDMGDSDVSNVDLTPIITQLTSIEGKIDLIPIENTVDLTSVETSLSAIKTDTDNIILNQTDVVDTTLIESKLEEEKTLISDLITTISNK